jgi:2-keto-4-pentenoate hydratase
VGVPHAISARIFASEIYDSGVTLPVSGFRVACVEPEIAAVLGDGVVDNPTPANRAEARAVIDRFQPAIELIDPRGVKMAPDMIPAAVALNVMNAGIVLGPDSVAPDQLDLTGMTVTMTLDGAVAVKVTDNAPQHPADSVMWLLHHLAQRGQPVKPGMVVMCGTHVPVWPLDPGIRAVDVEMSGLGSVSFRLQG